jgi:molybdenum cofactor cytidylyltransferase
MIFGPTPLAQAAGKILGHNIAGPDGRRALRKGKALTDEDIQVLRELGRHVVYVADLEPDDVEENGAALRIARAVTGDGLRLTGPSTGRVNLKSIGKGLLRVDAGRLSQLNGYLGVTLATLPTHTAVDAGKTVATVKIVPYAIPEATIHEIEHIASQDTSLIRVEAYRRQRAALIFSGSPTARDRILDGFDPPLRNRLEAHGAEIRSVDFVPLEDELGEKELANILRQHRAAGIELIILAGETAIMDRHDIAPRAVERAGGQVSCFGAPVDPGNLFMLAYLGDVPVLGAPGCARSRKVNIIDWVLPRLLAGDRLDQSDICQLGHGGLLEDVPERPVPRSRL